MRRLARRVAILTICTAVVVALATAGLFSAWLAGMKVPLASGATYMKVVRLQSARAAGEQQDGMVFIALVGSDLRPGVGGARADAIHLVGINVAEHKGTMINFPRDICYGGGKINATHGTDGPRGVADALSNLTGVGIEYAMSVNFEGFTAIVDGVGGVDVNVEEAMDDSYSGAVFGVGPNHMSGDRALAYSRDRHDFASGDLARTMNQGHLILEGVRHLRAQADTPSGKFHVMNLLVRHALLDGMGVGDLFRLGEIAFKTNPADVRNVPAPTTGGGCEGGLSLAGSAESLFADFRDDAILQTH